MDQHDNRIGPAGVTLLVLTALFVGWLVLRDRSPDPAALTTLERIRATDVIRIGYANEAPYGYLDSRTGEITGEAPEVARVILRRMGIGRIEPVVTEFGSLIPALKAGRFDVIAAGMYITPERAREIDFSNPTYAIGEAFLVRSGNPRALHSYEDVAAHASARIGVMAGSVEHGYAKTLGIPESRILVFPDYPSAVEGLKAKRVDAVAVTILTANDLLAKADDPQLERADPFTDPVIDGVSVKGYGAFGFRPEDDRLREAFNRHLAEFIGTPEHLDLVRPFGFGEATLPGEATAESVVEAR